jgi:Tol biopolymer transport system component/predicted Ser/Thr protein kinase
VFPKGSRLGPYEIVSLIGAGGMGEVYRAVDQRLNRAVALKVLHSPRALDSERRQRFEREARTVSALNHPHICTLYDIGQHDGVDFLVMEFLEGETLAARLESGALPLDDALRYAVQIAGALEKAHSAGIVHRDIKPANVMLVDRKSAKILDFGLAKLAEPSSASDATLTETRTLLTGEGVIVGTVPYMSPEQAEGKTVDARSDIFSFGSVLYEMVAHRRPFGGETPASTVSAILRDEPRPIAELVTGVPRELERVIARCLRKDPDRRFQHVGDVRIVLEEIQEGGLHEAPAAETRRRPWWILAAVGLVVAAGAAAAVLLPRKTPAEPALVLSRLTWDSGLTTDPALSPDGTLVAYASDRGDESNLDIWVQQVGGGVPIRLTHHEADDHEPSFSPDGTRIAFRSERDGGGIYGISALGGSDERLIAPNGRQPRFSPDGSLIAYIVGTPGIDQYPYTGSNTNWGSGAAQVYVVPATGGSPRRLAGSLSNASPPIWAPDGKSLLFVGRATSDAGPGWWVVDLKEDTPRRTGWTEAARKLGLANIVCEAWTREGMLVFSASLGDSRNLWEIPMSATGEAQGAPRRLTLGADDEGLVSASAAGQLAFVSLQESVNVWSVPIDPERATAIGPLRQLTQGAARATVPRLSDDGKKLVWASTRSRNSDVWIKDLVSGKTMALAATDKNENWPVFSHDASRVAYAILREGGHHDFYVIPAAGGVAEKVCEACGRPQHWSPDGKLLIYHTPENTVEALELASGKKTKILIPGQHSPFQETFAADGRWLSFLLRSGPERTQIFVAPFNGEAPIPEKEWIPVTDGRGAEDKPRWSPDGKILYFVSERDGFRCVWAQRLERTTRQPAGPAFPVYHAHSARRSLQRLALGGLELSVARDKIAFNLVERTGNIWLAQRQAPR